MLDALLLYPKLGTSMGTVVVDLPLSIVYAATDSIKSGYSVELLDLRCEKRPWKDIIDEYLARGIRLIGISVMTGLPLKNAREISLYVRSKSSDVRIVWGGPHVTVIPETIEESFIDFLVRGSGSLPLAQLIQNLRDENDDYSAILGLSYKADGNIVHNPRPDHHEMLTFEELPYHLMDVCSSCYQRVYSGIRAFPIFTAIGCPYRCSFCVHPRIYRVINGKKWMPYHEDQVVEHIQFLIRNYNATHICFIDDTSFVDIERMRRILQRIVDLDLGITMEFRGARINEIDMMDDEFLRLMVKAGGKFIMVGVESCSDRILKSMQKGITKAQILRVNEKLSRHPGIAPHYNLIYGIPGETYEDLVETKDVVLQMLKVNPHAYFGFGGDWKPVPGTKLLDLAVAKYGLVPPKTMDEWIEIDSTDMDEKLVHPWYTKPHDNLIKLMQVASFVIDDKIIKESQGNNSFAFRLFRLMSRVYKPFAWLRLKYNIHQFFFEYSLWRFMLKILPLFKLKKDES